MWPVLIQPVYYSGSNTAKLIAAVVVFLVVVTSQIIHITHTEGVGGGGKWSERDTVTEVHREEEEEREGGTETQRKTEKD